MKLVAYHAQFERPEVYRKCWTLFMNSAHKHGYHVTQLTSIDEKPQDCFGDEVIRIAVYPQDIVYSREVCFTEFLQRHAVDDEEYCFIEPDGVILKRFQPIPPDIDLVLLTRWYKKANVHPGIRFARKSAYPFFQRWLDEFDDIEGENPNNPKVPWKRWHGDVLALTRVLGHNNWLPKQRVTIEGVRIEFQSCKLYGHDAWIKNGYMVNFKGPAKDEKRERYLKEGV